MLETCDYAAACFAGAATSAVAAEPARFRPAAERFRRPGNSARLRLAARLQCRSGFTVAAAVSPSTAGLASAFFSGFSGLGTGFLAVSMRPSANSNTCALMNQPVQIRHHRRLFRRGFGRLGSAGFAGAAAVSPSQPARLGGCFRNRNHRRLGRRRERLDQFPPRAFRRAR